MVVVAGRVTEQGQSAVPLCGTRVACLPVCETGRAHPQSALWHVAAAPECHARTYVA